MKPIIALLFAAFALSIPFSAGAINSAPGTIDNTYFRLTVGDIVDMNVKEFKAVTGQKLSVKDRIVFGLVKHQLKRELRKGTIALDASAADSASRVEGSFNFGAFILGLLLGLIGFLIVILAFDDKQAWKWALVGMGVWIVLWVLFVV